MKILVVDDSRAMRSIVRRSLAGLPSLADAVVVEAANGREALELVRTEEPDLVVSDWNMPQMTGLELLRALRDAGVEVPFGFVTSETTPEMRQLAMDHGARFLVVKPFTRDTLGQALAGVV